MVRDSRAAIIRATVDRLRDGDGAFTYEHLAEQAGVARQTLYSHFPNRAELLVAAVEQIRGELDLEELTAKVYLAATARAAVEALLELHIAFTPPLLVGLRAVEAQRATHPEVSHAFERRSTGRRQLVLHVVTRLQAEGDLAPDWSVADAADLLSALLAGGFTAELLEEREWTDGEAPRPPAPPHRPRPAHRAQRFGQHGPTIHHHTPNKGEPDMTIDPEAIASNFYAVLERAWNDADGAAFAAPFVDQPSFVDIRGVAHDGGRAELAAGHQAIFASIYKGSVNSIELEFARLLSDDIILARGRATLDAPTGPLAGVIHSVNTSVLVRHDDGDWRAVSFHNTLVNSLVSS